MKYQVLLVTFLFCFCSSSFGKSKKPNIILINIDDLGWKDFGYMGSDYYETPNIDKLSESGKTFNNGYAAASNCAPSRACLMTGKWGPRHGVYTVRSSERGPVEQRKITPVQNTETLSKDHTLLSNILQNNGYITCHAGKWHLSEDPLEYGFDINIGGSSNGMPRSYYPPYQNVDLKAPNNEYLTDLIMHKAIQFIDTIDQPFFLNYSPYAVHTPLEAIDSLLAKYKGKAASNGQSNAKYATMVENLDRNIGLLMASLEERDMLQNTFIILTSDNGGIEGITSQAPLRAGKGSYYEGGIRVPYTFIWEGKIKPNTSNESQITNLDIFPTILKCAKIDDVANDLDGDNILPLLKKKKKEFHRSLYWHFPIYLQAYTQFAAKGNRDRYFRTRPGSAIRYGDWKLHYYFEDDEIELFNLKDDIGERNNLAEENIEKAEELLGYLKAWWEETNAPIPEK